MRNQSFYEQTFRQSFEKREQAFQLGLFNIWRDSNMAERFSQFIQAYFKPCISIFYVPRLAAQSFGKEGQC